MIRQPNKRAENENRQRRGHCQRCAVKAVLLLLLTVRVDPALILLEAVAQEEANGEQAADPWTEARRLYLMEEFDAARTKIAQAIAAEPNRYETWEAWVATYRPGPRLDEAAQELERRRAQDPENPRLLFAQGLAARCSGDLERASELFDSAARLDPESELIPLEHHRCFPNKDPRFKQLLEQAHRLNTENPAALSRWIWFQLTVEQRPADEVEAELRAEYPLATDALLGEFALGVFNRYREPNHQSHKRQAVELLEKFISARPEEAIAWQHLAKLYRSRGDYDKAFQAVERGQAIAWWRPAWLDQLEYLSYSRDGAQAAIEQSRRFTKFFPDHGRAWLVLGLDLSDVGRQDEAVAALRKSVACDWWRQDATARWNLAYILSQADKHSEALSVYLEILDVDPDYSSKRDVPGAVIRGLNSLSPQDHERLEAWLSRKVREHRGQAWPLLMRGRVSAAQKRHAAAAQSFQTVVERFPDEASAALTYWGKMFAQREEFSRAKERFLEALRRDPTNSASFDALMQLFNDDRLSTGEGDDAIQQLRLLIEQYPGSRDPLRYLGDALEKLGDQRGDHTLYEQALVPRHRLCSLNGRLENIADEEKKSCLRKLADLYAALGEFDAAFLFYERSGDEAFRRAAELMETAAASEEPFPLQEQRKPEAASPPQVFDSSNSVELGEGNKVNLQNANYMLGLTDVTFAEPTLLKIKRYYNSRSLHRGWFGFGWTTLFETEVGVNDAKDHLQVRTSSGYTVEFKTSFEYRKRVAEETLRRWKREGKSISEELRARLVEDEEFLTAEAERADVFGPKDPNGVSPIPEWKWLIRPGEKYSSPDGKLYVEDGQLVFYDADSKNTLRWNGDGYLFEISHPVLGRVHLEYEDRRPAKVTEPASGDWIKLEYNESGYVHRVVDSKGRNAVYIYRSDGDCLASRDADGRTLGFLYDRYSNLTAVRRTGGRTQRMQYHTAKDWALSLESADHHLRYEFDYFDYPRRNGALYATVVQSFWMGKPTAKSKAIYGEMALREKSSSDDETRFIGSQRQQKEQVYRLARDPLTEKYSSVVMNGQRSVLEWDETGRPLRILKPDGSIVHFSYFGKDLVIDAVTTDLGDYQYRHKDGAVESVVAPNRFSARIVREDGSPSRIESADWTIELVRDAGGDLADYRLRRDGAWRNIGRDAVERLHQAMNAKRQAWKLGEPINWTPDRDNADLQFVLAQLERLFDAVSRSTLPEHSLDCAQCFPGHFQKDLRGYDLATFEKQYLPKHR
jgi:YD repeat-containing protein